MPSTPAALPDQHIVYVTTHTKLTGVLDAHWVTPHPTPPAEFARAAASPDCIAQPWNGELGRIYLPAKQLTPQLFLHMAPERDAAHGQWNQRFALGARAVGHDSLEELIVEGLIVEEERFVVHDLLLYHGHWLLEQPFYLRRALLEQAFAELMRSGQAPAAGWHLTALYPRTQAVNGRAFDWTLRRLESAYLEEPLGPPAILGPAGFGSG
jgi:hypothetical protein